MESESRPYQAASPAAPPPAAPAEIPRARKRPPPRTAWKPGQSGNPGGRPKEVGHVRDLARQHTELALRTLIEIAARGTPDRARVAAAEALLDRAWGRPPQEITGPGGGPLQIRSWAELVTRVLDLPGVTPPASPPDAPNESDPNPANPAP